MGGGDSGITEAAGRRDSGCGGAWSGASGDGRTAGRRTGGAQANRHTGLPFRRTVIPLLSMT